MSCVALTIIGSPKLNFPFLLRKTPLRGNVIHGELNSSEEGKNHLRRRQNLITPNQKFSQ